MSKYRDKWGDIWKLVADGDKAWVVRVKDGNIGGWQNGEGLIEVKS